MEHVSRVRIAARCVAECEEVIVDEWCHEAGTSPVKLQKTLFNDFAYQLYMNLHEDGNDGERHEENLRECNQSQNVALLKFYQGDQKTSAPPTVLA